MNRMTREQFEMLKVGQDLYRKGLLSVSEAHKIHEIVPRLAAGEALTGSELRLVEKLDAVLFA
jgi:hypothetical protein